MCKASKCTIVEVEEIVEPGVIDPNNVSDLVSSIMRSAAGAYPFHLLSTITYW